MSDHIDPDHITIVRAIESVLPSLKEHLEAAQSESSVIIFVSIMLGSEVHAQPILMPVEIGNRLATATFGLPVLENLELARLLRGLLEIMRLNTATPAPMSFHIKFLAMFERALYTGMHDSREDVMALSNLTSGDLVIIQIMLDRENHEVISGFKIVKNPLQVWQAQTERNYVFPENHTTH